MRICAGLDEFDLKIYSLLLKHNMELLKLTYVAIVYIIAYTRDSCLGLKGVEICLYQMLYQSSVCLI